LLNGIRICRGQRAICGRSSRMAACRERLVRERSSVAQRRRLQHGQKGLSDDGWPGVRGV
jgi:hypothetical protein